MMNGEWRMENGMGMGMEKQEDGRREGEAKARPVRAKKA